MKGDYKKNYAFEERKKKHQLISLQKKCASIVVEKESGSKLPVLKVARLAVPREWVANQLLIFIRQKLNLRQEDGLYLYVQTKSIRQMEEKHRDEDGALYLTFNEMETFG
ncbi:uncharacterized protein LOC127595053 [Hippocampus zosterae]|uniref:uncharacterized protein LOC127595053 n=1 Tax=Hippocampus zosterae TaxID=109293 RepID=UPI00223E3F73|nr:uncharacterized protein LOC127595053 [Hippocampus zosterae]